MLNVRSSVLWPRQWLLGSMQNRQIHVFVNVFVPALQANNSDDILTGPAVNRSPSRTQKSLISFRLFAAHQSRRMILNAQEATAISFHRFPKTVTWSARDVNPIDEVHLPQPPCSATPAMNQQRRRRRGLVADLQRRRTESD